MSILFGIFEGIWRRFFGSDIIPRAILHIVNILITGFVLWYIHKTWWQIVPATLIFEFLYWARAHGEFFDYGHSQPPDVKRYEQFWWWKYVKKILPEDEWYSFECDYICMTIRYTLPAILVSAILLNWLFLFAGLGVATGYAICWKLCDKGKTNRPTEIGEFIAGFVSGLLLCI